MNSASHPIHRRARSATLRCRDHARGASLIEIMVGIVIGLIAVLVIYQVFAASEGLRRNTTGVGDAQQNGLLSTFSLGIELANAGNGIYAAAQELYGCPNKSADPATSLQPVPVLIQDSGGDSNPDELIVFYGSSNSLVVPAPFASSTSSTAATGKEVSVQSPMKAPLNAFKKGDVVVTLNLAIPCARTVVESAPDPDGNGAVKLGVRDAVTFDSGSQLLNLGPESRMQRTRYFVRDNVLYSQNLLDAAATPVPLASGVVNLKAQFGVDTDDDGYLDTWVTGSAAGFSKEELMQTAPIARISSIKAVRIGLITRSEQFDREAGTQDWTLFDCDLADKSKCAGRLTGTLAANWRYRVYETIVPLRNVIWNNAI